MDDILGVHEGKSVGDLCRVIARTCYRERADARQKSLHLPVGNEVDYKIFEILVI